MISSFHYPPKLEKVENPATWIAFILVVTLAIAVVSAVREHTLLKDEHITVLHKYENLLDAHIALQKDYLTLTTHCTI